MRVDIIGYYDIYGYNRATYEYDKWLGVATIAAASAIGAKAGRFVGYDKVTPDGWTYRASRWNASFGGLIFE